MISATKHRATAGGALALAAALGLAATSASAQAASDAAITNGTFTTPNVSGKWKTIGKDGDLGGWSVTKGDVDLMSQSYAQAPRGMQAVSLLGGSPGAITQNIMTDPGTTYTVKFLYGTDTWDSCDKKIAQKLVVSAGDEAGKSFNAGTPDGSANWKDGSYTFTATGSVTELNFESLTTQGWCGPTLTHVRLDQQGAGG